MTQGDLIVTNQEPLVISFQVQTDYPQALVTKVPKNLRTFYTNCDQLPNKFDELLLTVTSSPACSLHINTKCYLGTVRPIIEYACTVWAPHPI